jgi:hypothetical protein
MRSAAAVDSSREALRARTEPDVHGCGGRTGSRAFAPDAVRSAAAHAIAAGRLLTRLRPVRTPAISIPSAAVEAPDRP